MRPQVATGAAKAGRDPAKVALVSSVFVITGKDEAAMATMRDAVRSQIAFYASTPTYRVVLETHGWGEVGERLSGLAAQQRWGEMGALVSDEMLDVYAVEAPLDRLGMALRRRYEGVLDRIGLYFPFVPGEMDDAWRSIIAAVHAPLR